jgi:hypothetical protein
MATHQRLRQNCETAYQANLQIAESELASVRAEIDFKREHLAVAQLETERDEIRAAAEKLRHEQDARAAEYRELTRRLLEEQDKATIRSGAVREALINASGDRLSVPAPCAGPVVRLVVKRQDALVQEGEPLCDVAGSGERLEAELAVPPAGIGKIKLGQSVKLRYDAFPFERYGVRYATVNWVSSVSADGKDGPVFRALAGLRQQAVTIDGQPRPLLAGMGGRADVVVGRRSLAAYALERLRRLKESVAGGEGK